MHAMGGVIDMRRFGGLRHRLPLDLWTFAVGGLALAGIPPFSGFWSKDEILAGLDQASHVAGQHGGSRPGAIYAIIYWVALVTAGLTAFYTGRAFFLTFFGPEKLPSPDDPEAEADADAHAGHGPTRTRHGHDQAHGADHPIGHESPPLMVYPAGRPGRLRGPGGARLRADAPVRASPGADPGLRVARAGRARGRLADPVLGTIAGVLGLGLSYLHVRQAEPGPGPARRPDQAAVPGLVSTSSGSTRSTIGSSCGRPSPWRRSAEFLDHYLVDGLVRGIAWVPRLFGRDVLAPFQNGLIQFYAAATALSVAVLLMIFLLI